MVGAERVDLLAEREAPDLLAGVLDRVEGGGVPDPVSAQGGALGEGAADAVAWGWMELLGLRRRGEKERGCESWNRGERRKVEVEKKRQTIGRSFFFFFFKNAPIASTAAEGDTSSCR